MELQLLEVLILTETSRSKVFLFFSSLEMQAVTSRFDLSPRREPRISTMFYAMTRLQLPLELEI
jgi:hypothetical protein